MAVAVPTPDGLKSAICPRMEILDYRNIASIAPWYSWVGKSKFKTQRNKNGEMEFTLAEILPLDMYVI